MALGKEDSQHSARTKLSVIRNPLLAEISERPKGASHICMHSPVYKVE